ncbi:23585_t:CDS:2 [Gigaspora margarita]|uniref:23585_t:CDS:1 n=1 Tax=Gigaspora margarita TaxID=4874 RepID=A0ABM8VZ36_GIGMA|nr:23585_t:CDS:2 [Gigaspora margarita]
MKLIDISDLDDLAAQVNEQTANDEDFLKKISNRILARVLILQNRLYSGKDEDYEEKINNLRKIEKSNMVVSGHRTGRFKGDLNKIKEFLNSNKYDTFLIPYCEEVDELGKRFIYQIFYADSNIFKIDND